MLLPIVRQSLVEREIERERDGLGQEIQLPPFLFNKAIDIILPTQTLTLTLIIYQLQMILT
jgi:hypothetical protein